MLSDIGASVSPEVQRPGRDSKPRPAVRGDLVDKERVEDESVMVVLGQGDDEPFRSELEAAAAGHFDLRTVEVGHEPPGVVEDGNVGLQRGPTRIKTRLRF